MTRAKIFLRNLTANWVGHGANLVVMFFLSPYILHSLGVTQYGIWQLLTVLTGYMGIMDLGVRAGTGRYIILYLGKKDNKGVDETIRTGLGLYTAMSGFILGAGFLLGFFFPSLFNDIPQDQHKTIALLFPVLAVNIWISALRTILSSLLGAHERFDLARGSDLIMLGVRTIITIIILKTSPDLVGLTIAVVGSNIAGLIINIALCRRVHNNLRLWPLLLKKNRVSELLNYGIGAFILAASAKILSQTDLVIAGALIGINSVALYSVGAMLIFYSDTFTKQIDVTLFPSLQKAVASGNFKETRFIVYRQMRLSLILGILMYIGYFSFGKTFIFLWMFHPDSFPLPSVEKASLIMSILACAKLILLLGSLSRSILAATDNIKFAAKMTITEALINLMLSISFVTIFKLGLVGIALGTFASHLLIQTFILPYYAFKKIGINWGDFIFKTGFKGVLTAGFFFMVCSGVQNLYIVESWTGFFLQVMMSVLLYLPFAFALLFSKKDKQKFSNILRKYIFST